VDGVIGGDVTASSTASQVSTATLACAGVAASIIRTFSNDQNERTNCSWHTEHSSLPKSRILQLIFGRYVPVSW
jgi:hypothetical protein